MNTITYHSINAPANKAWLAYVVLPSSEKWRVFAEGATEDEAKQKIIALYERERAKCKVEYETLKLDSNGRTEHDSNAVPANPWGEVKAHHLAGLVWVVNKLTKDKRRVPPNELARYLEKGYERGGPRTVV